MKRFYLWILLFTIGALRISAETTLSYVGSTPASGSKISSFDITLEFDYDNIIQELGNDDYGISITGFYNVNVPTMTKAAELYEGNKETGTLLGRTMTSNVTGTSAAFKVGNSVSISFPDVIPENGKTYTLYISNGFNVQVKGKTANLAKVAPSYSSNNLILTFVGESGSSESLALESTSLRSQQDLDVLSAITYTFNNPVSVSADAEVQLKEGENIIAASTKFEQPDEKSVTFSFDDVELLLSHSYILTLPEGVVSMTSDSNKKNTVFDITLNGSLCKLIGLGNVTPPTDKKQIFSSDTIVASFNVPDGYKFYDPEGLANKYVAKLYQSEISDDNLMVSVPGVISQDNTVLWDLSGLSFSLMPATKYILYAPEGQFWVYDTNNKRVNEYSNAEVRIEYTTPSIEEAGYAPMELGKPTLPDGSILNDGDTFASLSYFEIAPPNLKYEYDGKLLGFWDDDYFGKVHGYLYDITDGTPVLVKELDIYVTTKETETASYGVLRFGINSILYEGHEYMIEMPEGAFTISSQKLWNYVRTPAFSIKVKGATPTEISLLSTSIPDNAECTSLYDVVFVFNGVLEVDPDASAIFNTYNEFLVRPESVPMSYSVSNNKTYINVHLSSLYSGTPKTLTNGRKYTLVIPEGVLHLASLPEITNKETTLTIMGVDPAPVYPAPEFVTLTVSYMTPTENESSGEYDAADYTTAYSVNNPQFFKGNTFSLGFDTDLWNVKHLVRFNGNETEGTDVSESVKQGVYTSDELNENARFEIVLEYNGDIVFTDASGVAQLDMLNARIFSDGDNIIVEGLEGGEHVTVYAPSGIVIGTHDAVNSYDTVAISAAKGQTYIVRIQRGDKAQAAKIMH